MNLLFLPSNMAVVQNLYCALAFFCNTIFALKSLLFPQMQVIRWMLNFVKHDKYSISLTTNHPFKQSSVKPSLSIAMPLEGCP